MYKNYIFDLYGTLIDINTDEDDINLWEKLSFIYGYKGAVYTAGELKNEYIKLVKKEKENVKINHPDYIHIDIKLENVFRQLYELKGLSVSDNTILSTAESFRSFSTKYIKLYDGVTKLLGLLKSNGKKIYLLSNAQRCFTIGEMVMLGIKDYFDGILISSDCLVSKPDPVYFNTIIEKYGLKKQDTLMIGNDYISDIQGAYNCKIDSLYIHQNISPDIKGELKSKWSVMDGDVTKITKILGFTN